MTITASFGETNPGRKRRRNEDAFVCEPPLFAVADGMGGAQAGEVASSLAAATLSGALGNHDPATSADAEQVVRDLISEANALVHARAVQDATASGMGTTMTVALAGSDERVTIGHVGDSRAYLLRDGSLEQLTDDHSLVAELVRRGELSPAEAEVHPQRSVITRALGTDPEVEIDVFSIEGRGGDLFLLCSDGLSTMVDGDMMAEIIERNRGDLEAATRELIRAANDGGGDDNITAVLFTIDGGNGADPAAGALSAETTDVLDPAEEDTLHPEDGVPVIVLADEQSADGVSVPEPPEEATASDDGGAEPAADGSDEPAPEPADTIIVRPPQPTSEEPAASGATEPDALQDSPTPGEVAEGEGAPAPPASAEAAVAAAVAAAEPDPPGFPFGRAVAATLVIVILATLIVVLALWGLAR